MKKRLFSIVSGLLFIMLCGNAASVTVDVGDLRYTVDTEAQTAELYGPVSSSKTITNLEIPDNIEYEGAQIPVTSIRASAFYSNQNLKGSLTIGDNVQTIGQTAFANCTGFNGSLTIGDNVQTIGQTAFSNCSGFTGTLTIGNNVQTIGDYAFADCSGFTGSLTIPNSVQTIGDYAFSLCSGFTGSLTIPNSVQTIGEHAFSHCVGFTGSLTIPNSVQTIGKDAFWNCSGFTGSLTIGDNVQTIGNRAFSYCKNFTGELVIPESVKEIGCDCFAYCDNLTSLVISSSNTVINYQAFIICYGFKTITCLSTTPPRCVYGESGGYYYDYVFHGIGMYDIPLYVPSESVNLYKNATEWKKFKYINPIPIEAKAISLNKNELNLLVGQEETLIPTLTPEDASTEIVWSVEDRNDIISVDQSGKVTAITTGTATVIATAEDVFAICNVTVYGADDVTVKPGDGTTSGNEDDTPGNNTENEGSLVGNDLTLRVNQTSTIDLEIPEGLSVEPTFAWSLDNAGAEFVTMTVKNNTLSAMFKGIKVGQTGYTVSIIGVNGNIEAVKGKITVIAEIPMTSLALDPASITMAQNALPQTIKPIYTPDNASMPEFNWTSSVPTVATVDQEGKVTPVGQGQTIITATALDGSGLSATSTVTVTAPIDEDFGFDESVMGGVEGVTIYIGDSYTLVPKAHDGYQLPENIVWSSSDDQTVSVDQNGKVTGLALGSATISATATINGKEITATCTVTVIPIQPTSISINIHGETTLEMNQTVQLTAEVLPENVTDKTVVWTSSNESVAKVTETGLVTALSAGESVITATNSAGQYDRVTITVLSNEPDVPELPEPVVSPADTPTQLLRKGDGTSHTFVAMMDKDDEILEAENYRYVFGYNNIADGTVVLEDTPWRYTHTNEDIYWNSSNYFWVFAYYVDDEGTLHVSSRRHLDGSIDNDFNAADLLGSATRSGEHIVGIYTVEGQFVGKDINKLETGIYIIRTSTSSYKIIR